MLLWSFAAWFSGTKAYVPLPDTLAACGDNCRNACTLVSGASRSARVLGRFKSLSEYPSAKKSDHCDEAVRFRQLAVLAVNHRIADRRVYSR